MDSDFLALSPEHWPFSLSLLPESAYLVGGSVRDALLGRKSDYFDLDFVLPVNAVKTARKIAQVCDGGFVLLDPQRQIARVVFAHGTADFAQQEGATLTQDLHRRDYTINAIAYSPHQRVFFDPLQGQVDLERRIIRMISQANLEDDPLRILRGYRQAAQLGLTIATDTRVAMRNCADLLVRVAKERILMEISYLLNHSQGTRWLTLAWEDGGLSAALQLDITAESLVQLAAIDRAVVILTENWPQLVLDLSVQVRGMYPLSWLAIAKLTSLLSPGIAKTELDPLLMRELKSSRAEIHAVNVLLQFLPKLRSLQTAADFSLPEQFFFFRTLEKGFPAIVVLALAVGADLDAIAPLIQRYLDPDDLVAHPIPLLNGKDLIQALQIPPGPQVGWLLTQIQLAHIEGKISTTEQAFIFAKKILATFPVKS